MRLPAVGKNIKLSIICEEIQQFFTEQQYQSSTHQVNEGYYVLGRPLSLKDKRPSAVVIVQGNPNEFTIEIKPTKPDSISARTRVGASILGTLAGLEIIKATNVYDQYIELEKRFWRFIKKAVNELAQSENGT